MFLGYLTCFIAPEYTKPLIDEARVIQVSPQSEIHSLKQSTVSFYQCQAATESENESPKTVFPHITNTDKSCFPDNSFVSGEKHGSKLFSRPPPALLYC